MHIYINIYYTYYLYTYIHRDMCDRVKVPTIAPLLGQPICPYRQKLLVSWLP